MSYTERFTEGHKVLAAIAYSGVTTEQNTSWISLQNYHRAVVMIICNNVTTTLDADIEVSNTGSGNGTNVFTLKSATQLTSGDDTAKVAFEIRSEELSKPVGASSDEYEFIRVETTPDGSGTYTVIVLGISPRTKPVGVSEWDEVVD